jgi:arylsulfatase A-like enzyme
VQRVVGRGRYRLARATLIGLLLAFPLAIVQQPLQLQRASAGTTSSLRPNVLIILMDDERTGGGSMSVMPKTRRWFRKAKRFMNFFVTTPLCCPSRSSILSGRYAHNHGVRKNSDASNLRPRSTIEHYLHRAGYLTGIVGKYLNKWEPTDLPPYFDRSALISDENNYENVYYNFRAGVDGHAVDYSGLSSYDKYSTHFVGDHALRFLRAWHRLNSERPWFMYVSPYSPHRPYQPEPRYRTWRATRWKPNPAVGEGNRSDKPRWVRGSHIDSAKASSIRMQQLRTLRSADDQVGRIFRRLVRQHDLHNTLVFFLSDNGFFWGEHGLKEKSGPYLPSVHVPMMMRWPGHIRPGRSRRIAANIDLAPTILSAAGIAPSTRFPIDGRSLLSEGRRRRLLLEYWKEGWERLRIPNWASTLGRHYQYIQYYRNSRVTFREYYNLRSDPWELHNLLDDGKRSNNPDVKTLSAELRRARICVGSNCP